MSYIQAAARRARSNVNMPIERQCMTFLLLLIVMFCIFITVYEIFVVEIRSTLTLTFSMDKCQIYQSKANIGIFNSVTVYEILTALKRLTQATLQYTADEINRRFTEAEAICDTANTFDQSCIKNSLRFVSGVAMLYLSGLYSVDVGIKR